MGAEPREERPAALWQGPRVTPDLRSASRVGVLASALPCHGTPRQPRSSIIVNTMDGRGGSCTAAGGSVGSCDDERTVVSCVIVVPGSYSKGRALSAADGVTDVNTAHGAIAIGGSPHL